MRRIYNAQRAIADTSDPDDVPVGSRVTDSEMGYGKTGATRLEQAYQRSINERRKQLKDGGNKGNLRHTHSVPAELFHGKIRQTGDKNYWADPKNLSKHSSCRVDR